MSQINNFIEITGATRRTAHYFLSINNNDVNNAVMSYFDLGADSIPEEYNPPEEIGSLRRNSSNLLTDIEELSLLEEIYNDSLPPLPPPPPPPLPPPPNISDIRISEKNSTILHKNIIQNENLPTNDIIEIENKINNKIEKINLKKILLKNEIKIEKFEIQVEESNYKFFLPKRELNNKNENLIIWKNGYSFNNNFIKLNNEEYHEFIKNIKTGKYLSDLIDITLINKREIDYK